MTTTPATSDLNQMLEGKQKQEMSKIKYLSSNVQINVNTKREVIPQTEKVAAALTRLKI